MSQLGTLLIDGDVEAESQMGSMQVVQTKRARKRSKVWKHFTETENGIKAMCKIAIKSLLAVPKLELAIYIVTLSQLVHPLEEKLALLKGKSSNLGEKYIPKLTRDMMNLLFIDIEIPFTVIDTRFLEHAMRSLNPKYRKIGRQILCNDCVGVFKAESNMTMQEFELLDSRVSFTSDIWILSTSLGYLCLTTHYIDSEFILQKKIIAFKKMEYPHTGMAIADLIEKIMVGWKLDNKIFTITLDNCSSNDNAIMHIENRSWKNMFLVKGEDTCT